MPRGNKPRNDSNNAPPTWLLGIGEVPAAPVTDHALNAACDFALDSWQILPAIWERLKMWAGPEIVQSATTQAVRDRLVAMKVMARVQYMLLERYTAELERRHIPYVLLKGDAARVLCYKHATGRCGVDLDIGIPKQCCPVAERIALEQGFVRAEWNSQTKRFYHGTPERRAEVEAKHYELGFLARDQVIADLDEKTKEAIRRDLPSQEPWHETESMSLGCYVTLDLHHGLTLACGMDGPLASSARTVHDGVPLRIPSVPWVIFHIVVKLYIEGAATYRTGGHQFGDLVRLVQLLDDRDAKTLTMIFLQYRMEVPAFYIMRRLASEFGLELPKTIRDLLVRHQKTPERGVDAYRDNDLGDVWPKLWGYREDSQLS